MSLSKSKATVAKKNINEGFKVPHSLVIISIIILLVGIATYLIPGGAYETIVNEAGKTIVVNDSFQYTSSNPQSIFDILQSPILGIIEASEIIAFLFIVSG